MGYRVALHGRQPLALGRGAARDRGPPRRRCRARKGYPTYLAQPAGQFYERAGRVAASGGAGARRGRSPSSAPSRRPAATSPSRSPRPRCAWPGALWALDPSLAHQRQFPAVDWETSYSLYADQRGTVVRARTPAPTGRTLRAATAGAAAARAGAARDRGPGRPRRAAGRATGWCSRRPRCVRETDPGPERLRPERRRRRRWRRPTALAAARASTLHRRGARRAGARRRSSSALNLGPDPPGALRRCAGRPRPTERRGSRAAEARGDRAAIGAEATVMSGLARTYHGAQSARLARCSSPAHAPGGPGRVGDRSGRPGSRRAGARSSTPARP